MAVEGGGRVRRPPDQGHREQAADTGSHGGPHEGGGSSVQDIRDTWPARDHDDEHPLEPAADGIRPRARDPVGAARVALNR